jgi:hypothetical protein
MPRGSKPGERRGGRQKGAPNKVTSAARQAFLATFGKLEGDLETWIRATADGVEQPLVLKTGPVMVNDKPVMVRVGADPGKAADLLIRMAEYHFPKLGRTEVTGEGGGPLRAVFRIEEPE